MSKLSLEMSIDSAYSVIDKSIVSVKSCVINLCSEIDRYFRMKYAINVSEPIENVDFNKIKNDFPSFNSMNREQFNRLLIVFKAIRDISAHLHLRKPIYLDDDIAEYLKDILEPDYKIKEDNKLTLYGQAYILYFFSNKYNLFTFITSYFSFQNFVEIRNLTGKEMNDYQVKTQHIVQEICGKGKPIFPTNVDKFQYQFMSNLFKKHMTRIIFSIERICSKTKKSFDTTWSLRKILRTTGAFDYDEDVLNLIIDLRNCWLHGYGLNEVCVIDDKEILLDYRFIFESFTKIKCLLTNKREFNLIIKELNEFAIACFNFYVLRIIEVSYKFLDRKLLTQEKVDSRIENIMFSYDRFIKADLNYFELAGSLIEPDDIVFKVSGCKFSDKFTRVTKCYKLNIIELHSENGFNIGDYHTDKNELVLANVDILNEYSNKINGKYLSEYKLSEEIKYGNRISVYTANM